MIVTVRATLTRRGGGMSGTWIGSRSKWRQVNGGRLARTPLYSRLAWLVATHLSVHTFLCTPASGAYGRGSPFSFLSFLSCIAYRWGDFLSLFVCFCSGRIPRARLSFAFVGAVLSQISRVALRQGWSLSHFVHWLLTSPGSVLDKSG